MSPLSSNDPDTLLDEEQPLTDDLTLADDQPLGEEPGPALGQPLGGQPKPRFRKPRADLYTVLLIVALTGLIIGSICLYLQLETFGHQTSGGPVPSARLMIETALGRTLG